ncbi:hypothetical protein HDU76_001516, partial [Blyttiomyces sp. JEL0837]
MTSACTWSLQIGLTGHSAMIRDYGGGSYEECISDNTDYNNCEAVLSCLSVGVILEAIGSGILLFQLIWPEHRLESILLKCDAAVLGLASVFLYTAISIDFTKTSRNISGPYTAVAASLGLLAVLLRLAFFWRTGFGIKRAEEPAFQERVTDVAGEVNQKSMENRNRQAPSDVTLRYAMSSPDMGVSATAELYSQSPTNNFHYASPLPPSPPLPPLPGPSSQPAYHVTLPAHPEKPGNLFPDDLNRVPTISRPAPAYMPIIAVSDPVVCGYSFSWTVSEVLDWLREKGYDYDVIGRFANLQIDGPKLHGLNFRCLANDMGFQDFNFQVQILRDIEALRPNSRDV